MKLKHLFFAFSVLAASMAIPSTAAAESWYEDCRDQAPSHYSCAQEYNTISVCCRHKYDGCKTSGGTGCASLFSGCVTANATGYVQCDANVTNAAGTTFKAGLTAEEKDDLVITLVLRELATVSPMKGRLIE